MKKAVIFSFVAVSMPLVIILVFNPRPVSGKGNPAPASPATAMPDSVKNVIQKAYMDCHSNSGSFLAKGKVNFSIWETYDADKQAGKAKAICKELGSGSMPPGKWRKNNPGAVPTQAQVDMICHWANNLLK